MRPKKTITLKSFNQKENIIFYPSDIKELLSYAWANSGSPSRILGARCEHAIQAGVRTSSNCLDTNPAAFFLTTVNLLGLYGQPFILDSAAGNEVWNQPIISYRYRYYKPGTHNLSDNLKDAIMPLKEFKDDPYAEYRSTRTTQIVGV